MNRIFKLFSLVFAAVLIIPSCTKDDDNVKVAPLRDYAAQYEVDKALIEEYLDTHFITVDADYNATITKIPTDGTQLSIREQTDYALDFKMVNRNSVDYKVYYLKLREGENERPTSLDSIHVSYRGNLAATGEQFDSAQNPMWFQLEDVVPGWAAIMPLFKTGNYDQTEGPNPVNFTGYGAGVMFLPSGLGYFGNPGVSGTIPVYSNLVFSFKLFALRYKDHDRDGIFSKDEVANPGDDPLEYDSDGDGFANMYDVDDDGDRILTKNEIQKDPITGIINFTDCDNDGIPDYLDAKLCP